MNSLRRTEPKAREKLDAEWDALAEHRHRQIESGTDLSFDNVLVPTVLRLLDGCDLRRVIDAGCGTGELTARIASRIASLVAIDPSVRSVEIAEQSCRGIPHVEILRGALEALASRLKERTFTVALAGMTLMTVPNLDGFVSNLSTLIRQGGRFVATMTHPFFWPRYWGYESEGWFRYDREIFVEAPFRISLDCSSTVTTHIHRPLEVYCRCFERYGFHLESLVEPMPSHEIERLYPKPWLYPRFVGMKWIRAT